MAQNANSQNGYDVSHDLSTPAVFQQSAASLGDPLFTAVAENRSGSNGVSWVEGGGLSVTVRAPTASDRGDATNPEELLALSWATCLNAAARVVASRDIEMRVRARVSLHERIDGEGFEFTAHAELQADGLDLQQTEALAAAAHARCPVSRMLSGQSPVTVTAVA